MEEAVGVKVTRLRRQGSVESDDATLTATPSTPTKKRGGRLAAKPQLELIDENATETTAKQTRKPASKVLAEPAEERAVTPSRRSTRVRSNTSIVSETTGEGTDEKPVTPARRSVRIRSNTSLVAEAIVNLDSPRAKRAARRNSQVGSDTEAPVTPARQARRTRKDSASSVDKAEINTNIIGSQIKEVIAEEVEINVKETNNNVTPKSDGLLVRKSPRLNGKMNKSPEAKKDNKENQPKIDGETNVVIQKNYKQPVKLSLSPSVTTECFVSLKPLSHSTESKTSAQNISTSSAKLLEQIETDTKKSHSIMNKSTSTIEESKPVKSKRHRTKSWTTISLPPSQDGSFYSDNEYQRRTKNDTFTPVNTSGSGDGITHSSDQSKRLREKDLGINIKGRENEKPETTETIPISVSSNTFSNSTTEAAPPKDVPNINENTLKTTENITEKLFKKCPNGIESLVYIEDSDSNSSSNRNENIEKPFKGFDDQCVPVVEYQNDENPKQDNNYSCEPMDIDETIPSDITHIQPETEKGNLSVLILNENDSINKNSNISKRKSSISKTESQNLDKSVNEDKSTLVLSQIKDISSQDTAEAIVTNNKVEKSELFSKSFNLQTEKNKDIEKKNLSLTYSTSTPLQQKPLKRLGMQINTSIITPNDQNKNEKGPKSTKIGTKSVLSHKSESDSSEGTDSEDESSVDLSKMVDDEAEEASANYESGDSRDDVERQYEEDNEIKEKGETLDSDEDEYSDDSNYEKDSFIVSSDDEDNELLSGSGDDLSISANELTMSAKSKKKFNDRKNKEKKKASKEMFEARHKLNDSDKNVKPRSKMRLDSSESEDDLNIKQKQKNRQRIDSYQDITNDNSLHKKRIETTRLADSESERSVTSEKEITICKGDKMNKKEDPLHLQDTIKQEPKTPQKMFDISTVEVISRDEVEEVKVDENVSVIMKPNETSDPLQNTILQNDPENDTEEDSLSENEEIKQNYNSVLNDLNNTNAMQIKSLDMYLNINKKTKTKTKEPIIDELNLTQAKISKNKKVVESSTSEINPKQTKQNGKSPMVDSDNEHSSDSIDMKLLFPEDSNDSEPFDVKQNTEETAPINGTKEMIEDFIPLKRTNAKTNILEDMDSNLSNDESTSKKNKRKKCKSPKIKNFEATNDQEDKSLSFIIDNTGTHLNEAELNRSLKGSAKKNKNQLNISSQAMNASIINYEDITYDVDNVEHSLINISSKDSAKKKKCKDVSETQIEIGTSPEQEEKIKNHIISIADIEDFNNGDQNQLDISTKSKKKNKKRNSCGQDAIDTNNKNNNHSLTMPEENSYDDETNSAKKKKHKVNTSLPNIDEIRYDLTGNNQLNTSVKGSKKNKSNIPLPNADDDNIETNMTSNTRKDSEKINLEETLINEEKDAEISNDHTVRSDKKNKKKKISESRSLEHTEAAYNANEFGNTIENSDKKKKKNKTAMNISQTPIVDEAVYKDNEPENTTENSEKKKKKKKKSGNTSHTLVVEDEITEKLDVTDVGHGKKKKVSLTLDQTETSHTTEVQRDEEKSSLKRKRKSSANKSADEIPVIDDVGSSKTLNESIMGVSKKKKRKTCNDDEVEKVDVNLDVLNEQPIVITKSKKNNKKINIKDDNIEQNTNDGHPMEVPISRKCIDNIDQSNTGVVKQNKKRKQRDDDENIKVSKILKQNSLDKIHVPRLPSDILKQLDDKPKKEIPETTKANIISTTPFIVEQAKKRKNKPSNYLEQSVCLNDSVEEDTRKTKINTKPKVLPFLPTVSTSDNGFTTTFRVNIIPQETKFVAQSSSVKNFKNQYLGKKSIKKLGTLEKYKRQMTAKLSKF